MKNAFLTIIGSILMSSVVFAQQTAEELAAKIQAAAQANSAKAIASLRYTNGEPEDLTKAISSMFALVERKDVRTSKPAVYKASEYTPEMKLPGTFQGKELEYLVPPTHWIVIDLSSPEGQVPEVRFKLTFPASEIDGIWRIPGIKFQ